MKKIFLALILFAGFAFAGDLPGVAEQQYVEGTEDLPLYVGFTTQDDSNVSYDSADGRILEATFFSSNAKPSDVQKFYDTTLPELGWKKSFSSKGYVRDGEALNIDVTEKDGGVELKFNIHPAS